MNSIQDEPDSSNKQVTSTDELINIRHKLDITQKMLKNKDETILVLEESLKFSRNQVKELHNTLQNDRDVRATEIMNFQQAISLHTNTIDELQRERMEHISEIKTGSINDDSFFPKLEIYSEIHDHEVEKYKREIDSLKFDLDIIEDLYKKCLEETMKQEKTIHSLREAYLDLRVNEIKIKADNKLLSSALKQNRASECKTCTERCAIMKETQNELSIVVAELNTLKNILHTEEKYDLWKESFIPALQMDNRSLKEENIQLKNKILELENATISQEKIKDFALNNTQIEKYLENKKLKSRHGHPKEKCKIIKLERKLSNMKTHMDLLKNDIANLKRRQDKEGVPTDISILGNQICDFEKRIIDYNKNIDHLQMDLSTTQELLKNLNEKIKCKDDSITWLELQLTESSTKGTELCNKSNEVYECVRKLLQKTKEEKKFMMTKIKMLQNMNKLLTLNENSSSNEKYFNFRIQN